MAISTYKSVIDVVSEDASVKTSKEKKQKTKKVNIDYK